MINKKNKFYVGKYPTEKENNYNLNLKTSSLMILKIQQNYY